MHQIVLNQPGQFVDQPATPPSPGDGEALVRVHRVGVCGTDLHAFAGRQPFFEYPRILGHELGVEVVHVGANDAGIQPGDRCAVQPYVDCGTCHACRIGKGNCCENMHVLGVHSDGGMRSMMTVPVRLLARSEKLSFDQLALVEALSIGAHGVLRGAVNSGEDVLVVGAGPIGLATTQFALAAGANVRVLELNPVRREFVEQRLNIPTLAEPDGLVADVVFDVTGNKHAMEASFQHVAHGGRLVFVGFVQENLTFDNPHFHRKEMTLLASRNSSGLFPKIIEMIEQGQIDTSPWITHRFTLRETPAKFPDLPGQPDLLKAMIEVEGDDD